MVIAALIALLAMGALVLTSGWVRHADGTGPLASLDGHGTEEMAVDRVAGVSSWTFGIPLCLAWGGGGAVIDAVGPTNSAGDGYRFLGAQVRTFRPSAEHEPISVDPYPPPARFVPDALRDARGYAVTTRCSPDPSRDSYTELLVGLGVTSNAGGGWRGIDVTYRYYAMKLVLRIGWTILICGTAVQADCHRPS